MKYLLVVGIIAILTLQVFAEKDYTSAVKFLAAKMETPAFKGSAYNRLAFISDTYGPRMWGSVAL
jgi:hypothetical protein